VLVADVAPEGPADKAGLQVGDVILTMNGKVMENARQLEVNLYRRPIGDKVTIAALRGDRKLSFEVEAVERHDDPLRFADMVDPENNVITKLGILGVEINRKIAAMLPELRKKYGVVVAARAAGSAYAGGVLQPGDVIYSVNGMPATSIAALRDTLEKIKPADPTVLQVERDGRLMYLDLELE
jgi:serine protease Do